jgi:hypothetical protein
MKFHCIDSKETSFSTFFSETGRKDFMINYRIIDVIIGTGRYVPRAVFIDLEPTVIGKYSFLIYLEIRRMYFLLSR